MASMNIFKDIPFNESGLGHRKVADTAELLIMQVALQPGQSVPLHKANSNVHLLVLQGKISVNLDGTDHFAETGDLLPVRFDTPMRIHNHGDGGDAAFLVLKAPHPDKYPG